MSQENGQDPQPNQQPETKAPAPVPSASQPVGIGVACKSCHQDITAHAVAGNIPIPVRIERNGNVQHALAPVIFVPVLCPLCGAPQLRREEAPRVIPAVPIITP